MASTHYPNEIVEFSVQQKIERGKPDWANYFRGVAAELIAAGTRSFSTYYTLADLLRNGSISAGQDAAILKVFQDPKISDGALPLARAGLAQVRVRRRGPRAMTTLVQRTRLADGRP